MSTNSNRLPDAGAQTHEAELQALVQERTALLEKANEELRRANADLLSAREQSWQNAEYLQAVLNHSPAAIGYVKAIFDTPNPMEGDLHTDTVLDYRLVALNEKFAALAGQPVGQLIGQSAGGLRSILWHNETFPNFRHVIAEDATLYEEREIDNEGHPRWLTLSAAKHDGGVVLTSLDITELRQTQLQREALRYRAKQSALIARQLAILQTQLRERGATFRVTSHDLRSSVGIVTGAAQLLQFAESDADRTPLLEMINRNAGEIIRLVTELVDLVPMGTAKPILPSE